MKVTFIFLCCVLASSLFSQSNINQTLSVNSTGAAANASAQLDVSATDKGMLVPRMTTAQRTAITAANALLVFDTDTKSFWFFDSAAAAWREIRAGNIATLADADGDTKIQVEESADEDIIRFDLGGTEHLVLRKNAGGSPRLELQNSLANTFVGADAGSANTTGTGNTASGKNVLYSNTSGDYNTGNGWQALYFNDTGFGNTGNGANALAFNTTGNSNTANGVNALYSNVVGVSNTAIGFSALTSNTTGSNNTGLGNETNVSAVNLSNATAIGNGATVNASNKIRFGNAAVTVIEGTVVYTVSDGRFKSEVRSDAPGLDFIRQLNPVTYRFDYTGFSKFLGEKSVDYDVLRQKEQRQEMGFVAQDLEKLMRESGLEISNLLHSPADEHDNYSIAYGQLVVPLVKAVQELAEQTGRQQAEIEKIKQLEAENAALKSQLDQITAALSRAGILQGSPSVPLEQGAGIAVEK